jgi:hypothetical protein
MNPHQCQGVQELNQILLKMGELDGAMLALKQQLQGIPKRLAAELKTEQERLDIARYLYWQMPDVHAEQIAGELLGMSIRGIHREAFLEKIGPFASEFLCARCGTNVVCRSRQELQDLHGPRPRGNNVFFGNGGTVEILCETCHRLARQEKLSNRRSA